MGPVVKMFTLGHSFIPDRIHSGGLRYHGDAPSLCMLVDKGVVEARAYKQNECFAEAVRFARTEGFLPAPESAHALRAVAQEAAAAREAGGERTILVGLSGDGHLDKFPYDADFRGQLGGGGPSQARVDARVEGVARR